MDPPLELPFSQLNNFPLVAFVTTRSGGVSRPPYDTLNMAYLTADDRDSVRTNRERVAGGLGLAHDELLIGRQVHGGVVNKAEDVELGTTLGDAIILTQPESAAMVVAADCLPLVFYDPRIHVGAVAHAGWRGLQAGILANTVASLESAGGAASAVLVGIGPGIGICCYEVGPEVIRGVGARSAEWRPGQGDRAYLDLVAVAERQLEAAGVSAGNVHAVAVCTRCNSDRYFSARAGEPTGRFAAGLKLL
ncbi:MAG: polyphenol oxidase family protein [Dehalococcoidia bacterium]